MSGLVHVRVVWHDTPNKIMIMTMMLMLIMFLANTYPTKTPVSPWAHGPATRAPTGQTAATLFPGPQQISLNCLLD